MPPRQTTAATKKRATARKAGGKVEKAPAISAVDAAVKAATHQKRKPKKSTAFIIPDYAPADPLSYPDLPLSLCPFNPRPITYNQPGFKGVVKTVPFLGSISWADGESAGSYTAYPELESSDVVIKMIERAGSKDAAALPTSLAARHVMARCDIDGHGVMTDGDGKRVQVRLISPDLMAFEREVSVHEHGRRPNGISDLLFPLVFQGVTLDPAARNAGLGDLMNALVLEVPEGAGPRHVWTSEEVSAVKDAYLRVHNEGWCHSNVSPRNVWFAEHREAGAGVRCWILNWEESKPKQHGIGMWVPWGGTRPEWMAYLTTEVEEVEEMCREMMKDAKDR